MKCTLPKEENIQRTFKAFINIDGIFFTSNLLHFNAKRSFSDSFAVELWLFGSILIYRPTFSQNFPGN
jgi:hypothetical protein